MKTFTMKPVSRRRKIAYKTEVHLSIETIFAHAIHLTTVMGEQVGHRRFQHDVNGVHITFDADLQAVIINIAKEAPFETVFKWSMAPNQPIGTAMRYQPGEWEGMLADLVRLSYTTEEAA